MTKNRIPRRDLSERKRVVARILQDAAYATYHDNRVIACGNRVRERLAERAAAHAAHADERISA